MASLSTLSGRESAGWSCGRDRQDNFEYSEEKDYKEWCAQGGNLLTEFAGEGWDDLLKQLVEKGLDVETKGILFFLGYVT